MDLIITKEAFEQWSITPEDVQLKLNGDVFLNDELTNLTWTIEYMSIKANHSHDAIVIKVKGDL